MMKKFGKKALAVALGAMMTISSLPASVVPVFADAPSVTVTFDGNGGMVDGMSSKEVTVSGTLTANASHHTKNFDDDGNMTGKIKDPLADSEYGSYELVSATKDKDGVTYKLMSATISGTYQPGPLYDLEVSDDEGQSFANGDPEEVNTIDGATTSPITVTLSESSVTVEPPEEGEEAPEYVGHYVKTTAYYGSMSTVELPTPEWDGHEFMGWASDPDGTTPWDKDSAPLETQTVYAIWQEVTPTTYTVTFTDGFGTDLKTEEVEEGQSATPPEDPKHEGLVFIGWDKDFSNVTEPLTVTAQWEEEPTPETFVVTFTDSIDGKVVDTQTVQKGSDADGEAAKAKLPEHEGYEFEKWNPEDLTNVQQDMNVESVWKQVEPPTDTVTVTFMDGEAVVDTQTIDKGGDADGDAAKAKINMEAHLGAEFTGWDKPLTNIQENLIVNAVWQPVVPPTDKVIVTFMDGEAVVDTQTIDKGGNADGDAAKAKINMEAHIGAKFDGWDKSLTNVQENLVTKALWKAITPTPTPPTPSPVPTQTGTLVLTNVIKGTGANLDKKFKFTIGLTTSEGIVVNETFPCTGVSGGKITFTDGKAIVKLANEESVTITEIPKGYGVTIDQDAVDGYTTKPASRHASGTMTTGKLTATFTNTKSSETPTPTPTTEPTGTITPTPTTVPTSTSNLTFSHITTGDGADKEKKFVYTLTVTNNGAPLTGSFSYSGTGAGTVAFSAEGKISFTMKDGQTLTIQGLPTGSYYTISKNENNDGYGFTKDREDGQISGDMTVTLTETKGGADGTNTGTNGTNADGTKPTTSPSASMSNVKTGDQSPIIPFVVIGGVAILALILALVFGKKKKAS